MWFTQITFYFICILSSFTTLIKQHFKQPLQYLQTDIFSAHKHFFSLLCMYKIFKW